jgi:transcriptional regulator with GAF, ATPase, and Fis domain
MAGTDLPSFHGIIGRSAAMQALFRRIEKFAPRDVSVLIQGETGTGKDLVASTVQRLSSRQERRFEVINCATLTRELLPSELFGHERGAFTGAVARKEGLLALATGGTMFLDEVGELPLETQAMLLRFLEGGELRPVGSTRTIMADVRVIAATNRDLEEAVRRREFREDLYHRLSDIVLEVPPLRARREDIPLLVEHFRVFFNGRFDLAVEGLAPEALAMMMTHGWPGNVRALEKVLREAMLMREVGWVQQDDLRIAGGVESRQLAEARASPVQPVPVVGGPLPADKRRETALRMPRNRVP